MLLTISGAAGAVVLAILFPHTTPNHVSEISWGLFIVTSVLAVTIALMAHLKISADHEIYVNFGKEYVKTCILLGFYKVNVEVDDNGTNKQEPLKMSKAIGQGTGYRRTQAIIWTFAGVLVVLTFLFAYFSSRLV